MLQFITNNNIDLPVTEQAKAVIESGCRWIQMSVDNLTTDQQKQLAEELIPLCKPSDAFMVIEHNVELVDLLKVHGVHLFPGDMLPREAREKLGAHAVIGVTVTTAEEIINLRTADIDYVQVGPFPQVSLENYASIIARLEEAGVKIPVVATGNISPANITDILKTGVKGVGVSTNDTNAESLSTTISDFLN